jgi:hypothetical protein
MWMIAVCCMRRASICDARDNPLRDFMPTAHARGAEVEGFLRASGVRRGRDLYQGGKVQGFHAGQPPSSGCSQRVAWSAPPFARMVGRDFAYVHSFVITLSFLVGAQPRHHLAETAFLPIVDGIGFATRVKLGSGPCHQGLFLPAPDKPLEL